MAQPGEGRLVVVATPIGNLGDLSPRAHDLLNTADVIACEDTRHTRKLLSHFGIPTPTISLHEHNEEKRIDAMLKRLAAGETVALVSDAGTPLVSDPGYRLVVAVANAGFPVGHLPGPSAVVAALVLAGLPTDDFRFVGFMPDKSGKRRSKLEQYRGCETTLVLFESPQRVRGLLSDLEQLFGDRPAALVRELTKIYEEALRGSLQSISAELKSRSQLKGECVVLVDLRGTSAQTLPDDALLALVQHYCDSGLSSSRAVKQVIELTGASRTRLYNLWQEHQTD